MTGRAHLPTGAGNVSGGIDDIRLARRLEGCRRQAWLWVSSGQAGAGLPSHTHAM